MVPGPPPATARPGRPSSAKLSSAMSATVAGTSPPVRAAGGATTRGSVIWRPSGTASSPVSRCGGSAAAEAKTSRPPIRTWTVSGVWATIVSSSPSTGAALAIAATSSGPGRAASRSGAKCCCISSGPGAVQPGWPAPRNRVITQPSWGSTWHSAVGSSLMRCLSAVQLGWPYSQAMASCASCRAGNSPAARRRFASSFRYRRLGRPGSGRVDVLVLGMAALPHARWSARSGQERLAVD